MTEITDNTSTKDLTRTEILRRAVTFTTSAEESYARAHSDVDLAEVAGATLERLLHDLDHDRSFPWAEPEKRLGLLWKRALAEQRSLARYRHTSISHDVVDRARTARNAAEDAGLPLTVEAVYAAGADQGAKSRPSKDAVFAFLTASSEELDGFTASQRAAIENRPFEDDSEPAPQLSFLPTAQTLADLEVLKAARASSRNRDDGGIDCSRLDIVALLRFEMKRYDNGTETRAYPPRKARTLLGVTEERYAELEAELDAVIALARSEAASADAEREAVLAAADARWERAARF